MQKVGGHHAGRPETGKLLHDVFPIWGGRPQQKAMFSNHFRKAIFQNRSENLSFRRRHPSRSRKNIERECQPKSQVPIFTPKMNKYGHVRLASWK